MMRTDWSLMVEYALTKLLPGWTVSYMQTFTGHVSMCVGKEFVFTPMELMHDENGTAIKNAILNAIPEYRKVVVNRTMRVRSPRYTSTLGVRRNRNGI